LNKASLGYCAPDRCVPTLDRDTQGPHNAWVSQKAFKKSVFRDGMVGSGAQ
jgi:hypothetical protein